MRKYVKLDVPEVSIHPLRVTEGWNVHYNNFLGNRSADVRYR